MTPVLRVSMILRAECIQQPRLELSAVFFCSHLHRQVQGGFGYNSQGISKVTWLLGRLHVDQQKTFRFHGTKI